jgi:hypothetical protein
VSRSGLRSDSEHGRAQTNTVAREQLGTDRAGGNPRGGLSRGGAFQHVAHVLELAGRRTTRVVGVSGTRPGHRPFGRLLGVHLPGVHHLRPVLPVAVADLEDQGGAQGTAAAQAPADLHLVGLDALPPAAAKAVLAATEPVVYALAIDHQAGGQALEDGGQPRTVRLATGEQAELFHAPEDTRTTAPIQGEPETRSPPSPVAGGIIAAS